MKRKTLIKKITTLEARLQKGAKKLAKLKRKLAATATKSADKTKEKLAVRDGADSQVKAPTRDGGKKGSAKPKAASAKKRRAPRKVKRKLNLSPERRAQLATAMKARWAAKRAAEGTPPAAGDGDFTLGQTPQSP